MIYFLQDSVTHKIKIGFVAEATSEAMETRRKTLQTGNPSDLVFLGWSHGTRSDEAALHRNFAGSRCAGEWFDPTPCLLLHILSCEKGNAVSAERREAEQETARERELLLTGPRTIDEYEAAGGRFVCYSEYTGVLPGFSDCNPESRRQYDAIVTLPRRVRQYLGRLLVERDRAREAAATRRACALPMGA